MVRSPAQARQNIKKSSLHYPPDVLNLGKHNFNETIDADEKTIVDFYAPWCCPQFAQIYLSAFAYSVTSRVPDPPAQVSTLSAFCTHLRSHGHKEATWSAFRGCELRVARHSLRLSGHQGFPNSSGVPWWKQMPSRQMAHGVRDQRARRFHREGADLADRKSVV